MTLMQLLLSGLANYRTTILGLVAGTGSWSALIGAKLPQTSAEWGGFLVSVAIAIGGLLAKDSATGSQPANAVAPEPTPAKQGAAVDANLNIVSSIRKP